MLGRVRPTPALSDDAARLARLESAIDDTLTMLRAAATANNANRDLVDLALDANNILVSGLTRP